MTDQTMLQTDQNQEIENDEGLETVDNDSADLATATGENQTKSKDSGFNQDKANAAINKQHAKYRQEERLRLAAEAENEKLKQQLAEATAKSDEVVIPPMPDPYDSDFDQRVAARDEAIRLKAERDAEKKRVANQQKDKEAAAKNAEIEAFNKLAEQYSGRATTFGISQEQMKQSGEIVGSYLRNQDMVSFILEHKSGPLITKYLANNPIELQELSVMNPIQASMVLQSKIIPAAELLKPKASAAPDPIEDIGGRGGNLESNSGFLRGAKFE